MPRRVDRASCISCSRSSAASIASKCSDAGVGFRKHVMETREPLHDGEMHAGGRRPYENPEAVVGEPSNGSALFQPLVLGGRATGVISLQNLDREHAFDAADLRLLATIAGSLGVALENARLVHETRQRNAELALINSVQAAIAGELDPQAIYDLVGERSPRGLRCPGRRHRGRSTKPPASCITRTRSSGVRASRRADRADGIRST